MNELQPIKSLAEASNYLEKFYHNVRADYTLDNMQALMMFLDNPQEKLKIIHVAGTSGKTSTSYFISALLAAAGQKVGLTISPHVDALNERLQINGVPLSEKDFCKALTEFARLVEKSGVEPTWFEFMVSFVYWYFAKAKVDYAVVEVGLGGLLDGTNVAGREDKVCIITDIGMDHQNVLGDTLPEIAAQKIGIVKPGNTVFTHKQSKEIIEVFYHWTLENDATLRIVERNVDTAENIPAYQLRNWSLAYEAFKFIVKRDGLTYPTVPEILKTQHVIVPGRMDVINYKGKTLVMDGAHNLQKMKAFLYSFGKIYSDSKPSVLISLKDGKEYQDLVPLLKPVTSRVIVTSFEAHQDVKSTSMDADKLIKAFNEAGIDAVNLPDQHKAFEALVSGPEKVCVITGSFYLLGQIRNNEHLV